jgi:tRNA(Ile)-lysidine synthase
VTILPFTNYHLTKNKMLSEFEKKVAGFVRANGLFQPADRVLLAVSGGADSTALLHVMCKLKTEGVLRNEMICAHINHQLRGTDAQLDEDFVIAQAKDLNLPIITKRIDVQGFAHKNKLSIETAARKLRIKSLLDIAKANDCHWIATGHQKNDNAETVLQRLLRGTGFRGLGGIWAVRSFAAPLLASGKRQGGRFARPLRCVRRDEIIEYLTKRNSKWRVDKTNENCSYRRNFIRHRLLPMLQQQCNSSIVEQLSLLSQSAQRFYHLVCNSVDKVWPQLADCIDDKIKLDVKLFLSQPEPVKVELVRRSLTTIGCGEKDLAQKHYERILQLANQNISGKKINLPNGFLVLSEYGRLIFTRAKRSPQLEEQISKGTKIEIPGQTRFGDYLVEATILDAGYSADRRPVEILDARRRRKSRIENQESRIEPVEWFDLDKLILPLEIRFRQDGDKFWPLGLASEKKVGKFLTAEKVPQKIRQKLLIVTDSEKIIWVWPIRISEQAKITEETQKILQLQITEANPAN